MFRRFWNWLFPPDAIEEPAKEGPIYRGPWELEFQPIATMSTLLNCCSEPSPWKDGVSIYCGSCGMRCFPEKWKR